MTLKWKNHKLDVKISLRKNLEVSFAYNSGSAPPGCSGSYCWKESTMNVTRKISHFLQITIIDSSTYYKTYMDRSKRSQKWKTNFWWVCFGWLHVTTFTSRFYRDGLRTHYFICKHLRTHLDARNTLTREISRPIRTILVFDQIICVNFGI